MTPNELTSICSPIIAKIVSKMFGEDEQDEASQAIWLSILNSNVAGRYDPEKGPMDHLIYMASKNAALDFKRASERHARMDRDIQEGLAVLIPAQVEADEGMCFPEFEGTEACQVQQATVLKYLLEGYNQKEIAEREGYTTTRSNKITNAVRAAALGVPRLAKDYKP